MSLARVHLQKFGNLLQKLSANGIQIAIPGNTIVGASMDSSPNRHVRETHSVEYPTLARPKWVIEATLKGELAFSVQRGQPNLVTDRYFLVYNNIGYGPETSFHSGKGLNHHHSQRIFNVHAVSMCIHKLLVNFSLKKVQVTRTSRSSTLEIAGDWNY